MAVPPAFHPLRRGGEADRRARVQPAMTIEKRPYLPSSRNTTLMVPHRGGGMRPPGRQVESSAARRGQRYSVVTATLVGPRTAPPDP